MWWKGVTKNYKPLIFQKKTPSYAEFTQIEAGNVVTVQRNGESQEQIPLSQPSGDTATDSMHLGQKQGRSVNLYKLYQ